MNKIKIRYTERSYKTFEIVDEIPAIGDTVGIFGDPEKVISVFQTSPDYEERSEEASLYDYYIIESERSYDEEHFEYFFAIKKESEDE